MARAPSKPKAAPAGEPAETPGEKGGGGRTKQLMTGAAIGIGSAALVAALLYANRSRKADKG